MEFNNACDVAQLAGQWYADFLCWDGFPRAEKVKRALAAICKLNELRNGVMQGLNPDTSPCTNPESVGFPPETDQRVAVLRHRVAQLIIANGYPDRGLFAVQRSAKTCTLGEAAC